MFEKVEIGEATLYRGDCLCAMREMPDNAFDLAIVDPPYGIDAGNMVMGKGKEKKWAKGQDWDKAIPSPEYFSELSRVSRRQIVFGGNYFPLPLTGGWLYWNKNRQKDVSFADGELAWTNFLNVLKEVKITYDGFLGADKDGRIHATQKPVKLYRKLLLDYAKPGDRILDTHHGSGSNAIACLDMGFSITAYEIDEDYFRASCRRIEEFQKQLRLFG